MIEDPVDVSAGGTQRRVASPSGPAWSPLPPVVSGGVLELAGLAGLGLGGALPPLPPLSPLPEALGLSPMPRVMDLPPLPGVAPATATTTLGRAPAPTAWRAPRDLSAEPLEVVEPLSEPPPLPPELDGEAPRQPPPLPERSRRLGAFDDPWSGASGEDDVADDEPTAFVVRPKRIEVDGNAVLRVRGRSLPVRVYNLSATGAFVSIELEALPALGEEVELGAVGYQPVRARVMHGRPRDEVHGVPAGLGLELIPDPSTRHPTTIAHVLLVTADAELRRLLAASVAEVSMLPVPAADLVAAYVASHTVPLSVVVLDPAVQALGDWRDVPEGFGLAQRGTPVIALQRGRRLRGLPPWIVPASVEALARALRDAVHPKV
jgi:hypothetical protein